MFRAPQQAMPFPVLHLFTRSVDQAAVQSSREILVRPMSLDTPFQTAARSLRLAPSGALSDPGSDEPEGLSVDVDSDDDVDVVTVAGELDLATGPHLREVLRGLLAMSRNQLVVDLDRVTFIDSTGLGVLIAVHRRVLAAAGSLALVCNSPRCMRLMEITGMTRVFTFHDTAKDAVEAMRASCQVEEAGG